MNSPKVYIKDRSEVVVAPKFVYCISTYKFWKQGACLMDEKYYANQQPFDLKKIPTILKKKGYTIQRFIKLESAPEEYLINKGYKQKQV